MQFDVSTSPYGPQDEIGRLNEKTPASRQRVLARVDGLAGALAFALSFGAAATSYYLVERPFLRWKARLARA